MVDSNVHSMHAKKETRTILVSTARLLLRVYMDCHDRTLGVSTNSAQ